MHNASQQIVSSGRCRSMWSRTEFSRFSCIRNPVIVFVRILQPGIMKVSHFSWFYGKPYWRSHFACWFVSFSAENRKISPKLEVNQSPESTKVLGAAQVPEEVGRGNVGGQHNWNAYQQQQHEEIRCLSFLERSSVGHLDLRCPPTAHTPSQSYWSLVYRGRWPWNHKSCACPDQWDSQHGTVRDNGDCQEQRMFCGLRPSAPEK